MKRLNIDYKKHMGYSRTAEKGIKARLRMKYSPEECERLMEKIDRQYEEFLKDLPYCGGKHNIMIWQLYDAIAAFAYYEVLPEKETPEEFEKTCIVIYGLDKKHKQLPRFMTLGNQPFINFVRTAIKPIASYMNKNLASRKWEDGWHIEMETDHLQEGIQVALVGCPIYNFAHKHGYDRLMPAMCNPDFPGFASVNAGLIRPRTVSNGDDRCDYWYVSLDSETLKKYPPEMKENGLLISKDWRPAGSD